MGYRHCATQTGSAGARSQDQWHLTQSSANMHVTVTTLLLLLLASVRAQAPCNLHEAEVRRTSERCCRCIEADNCNGGGELEAELFPGYNCNEVDYDYDESSCRLEGLEAGAEEGGGGGGDNVTVSVIITDLLGLRRDEPGDQVIIQGPTFSIFI